MPTIYNAATKTARMQVIITQIDAGAGPGTVEICTAGYASVLASLALADPCGSVTGNVLNFDLDPDIADVSADATGAAAVARFKDGNGTVILSGWAVTLAGGGGEVILDSLDITAGQRVELALGTLTHADDPA